MIDVVLDLRDGGDWSLDLCFAGLVKNLGPAHVVDIPHKNKHREWLNCNRLTNDWGRERRTLGHTPDNNRINSMHPEELSRCREAGIIRRVWLDERMESFAAYRQLGLNGIPVVVVAGHDRFWNHSPQFVASLYGERLEAMLLDNWYPEYACYPFRTRRIGWSCNFDHYWDRPPVAPEKEFDICFVGYNSHPDRARFVDHIERRWGHLNNHIYLERRPDTFEAFVPKSELFSIMQRSKVCLNLRGAADRGKTLRAYEITYVGSFMLSQRIDDPGMMEDFIEGFHCSYFSDEAELDDKVEQYIYEMVGWRESIAKFGHRHAIEDLSVESRWRDVLKWLEDGRPVQEAVR